MSRLTKRVTALAAAALATAVIILGPGAPANAADRSATCSVGSNYFGRGDVWYTYTGGYDYIDYYEYTQQNGGPKTDVRIQQYSDSTIIYQWVDDAIPHYAWESHNPSQTVRIIGSAAAKTLFRFAFDQFFDDPICSAITTTW
ncbi:hypothetical protein [Allorhizocola rhizosphaerae]|uniref:hypothetical protein n=1 Tax=Allorhizocola rhizosphaerae TaxID=1872709 RepID=UPI000E3BE66C|nr:hypothetical protein [Allorhizocola rhizosphaerae]